MKNKIKSTLALILIGIFSINVSAQSMEKKFRAVKVEMKIEAPAERVWKAMVLDY
ncbi:hypothetical protein [Aquimarina sp. AU119]|nr:hypothetical protein [Aquimarina sp. AU119]